MSDLWARLWAKFKRNPWVFLTVCGWMLLVFIFTMQRHGSLILSHDIYSVLWEKLGNIVLLRWVNSTLITGLLALVAATIGANALFATSKTQEKLQKITAIRRCKAHCSIIRDELSAEIPIAEEDARLFMTAADQLCAIDVELTWLAVCIARHVQNLSREAKQSGKKYNITYLKCAYLLLLLDHIENILENNLNLTVRESNFVPPTLLNDLEKRGLTIADTGEFDSLFDWKKRVQVHLVDQPAA